MQKKDISFLIAEEASPSDSANEEADSEQENIDSASSESSSDSEDSTESDSSSSESESELKLLGNIKAKEANSPSAWKEERKELKQKRKKVVDPAQKLADLKQEQVRYFYHFTSEMIFLRI